MIYMVLIPIALLFVPWLLARYVFVTDVTRNLSYKKYALYLIVASAAWLMAMTLPNVPISPQTNTTTMHTLGGVVAAILFMYFMRVYNVKFKAWWQPWVALYFFISGLGVANELLEFFLDISGIQEIPSGDEWWDLAANTFGGFGVYLLVSLFKISGSK